MPDQYALHKTRAAAEVGNPEAMLELALELQRNSPNENPREAANWAKQAARAGNVRAKTVFGCFLQEGYGVEKSLPASVYWLKQAAEEGCSLAAYRLGLAYQEPPLNDMKMSVAWLKTSVQLDGEGSTESARILANSCLSSDSSEDQLTGLRMLHLAASRGCRSSQARLAFYYRTGRRCIRDTRKSFALSRMSAESGDSDGMIELALHYKYGSGTSHDRLLHQQWLMRSFKNGNVRAAILLSEDFIRAPGRCHENLELVESAMRAAAGSGDHPSMYNLALALTNSILPTRDDHEGFFWYQMAMERAYLPAFPCVAWCHDEGVGTEKNPKRAREILDEAIKKGCPTSMCYMAEIVGRDPEPDYDLIRLLYTKACAKHDHAQAAYQLGLMSVNGHGCRASWVDALGWFHIASSLGEPQASYALARRMEKDGEAATEDIIELYQKAANAGMTKAMLRLSMLYREHSGDNEKASYWWTKARSLRKAHKVTRQRCEIIPFRNSSSRQ